MKASVVSAPVDARELYQVELTSLDGKQFKLGDFKGLLVLVVNVASKCGLTPQYEALERIYRQYRDKGFEVLGFPCNQFGEQEPGTPEEIAEFCDRTYGVSFPLFAKIDVNGENRHPLYHLLTQVPDNEGREGDILWNFEKFLISPEGEILARFDPRVTPEDPRLVELIEANLPK